MSETPTIRRATKADLPAVARLAAELVRLHHSMDPRRFLCEEPIEPGYERWFRQELQNPKALVLVAERAGENDAPRRSSDMPTAAWKRATGTPSSTPVAGYTMYTSREKRAPAAWAPPSWRRPRGT